jgi:uroporphyrinogen-III synthase
VAAAGRPRPARQARRLTIDGRVDAVVFTSQVQVRHFLEVAARSEREAPLIEALNAWTVTASIGPTCSAALVARGITPRIEPSRPKLGPLVERVVQYLAVEGSGARRERRATPNIERPR